MEKLFTREQARRFLSENKLTTADSIAEALKHQFEESVREEESKKYDLTADDKDVFISNDGKSHLNLITCAGVWNQGRSPNRDRYRGRDGSIRRTFNGVPLRSFVINLALRILPAISIKTRQKGSRWPGVSQNLKWAFTRSQ